MRINQSFHSSPLASVLQKHNVSTGSAIALAFGTVTSSALVTTKTVRHIDLKPDTKRTAKLKMPTLLIPGITDLGKMMRPLRNHLRSENIAAHIWGSKRNNGPTRFGVPKLINVFKDFSNSVDEPVILIGHSFGGLMSLFLARMFPEKVKAVILLASPCQLGFNDIEANTVFGKMFKLIEAGKSLFHQDILHGWVGEQDRQPALPMPIISFVACKDKNVNAFSCKAPDGPLNRNIFIDCDHGEIKDHEAVKAAIVYMYEHGFDAEFPGWIIDLGIVDESKVVNHFALADNTQLFIEHPPIHIEAGVLSITSR